MDTAGSWLRQHAGSAGKTFGKMVRTFQHATAPADPTVKLVAAEAALSSEGALPNTTWGALMLTFLLMVAGTLLLLLEKALFQSAVADPNRREPSNATYRGQPVSKASTETAAEAAAEQVSLPPPPSALPAPPSAPLGSTMVMDASYVAVGSHELNGERAEADFEMVGKPKWHASSFSQ